MSPGRDGQRSRRVLSGSRTVTPWASSHSISGTATRRLVPHACRAWLSVKGCGDRRPAGPGPAPRRPAPGRRRRRSAAAARCGPRRPAPARPARRRPGRRPRGRRTGRRPAGRGSPSTARCTASGQPGRDVDHPPVAQRRAAAGRRRAPARRPGSSSARRSDLDRRAGLERAQPPVPGHDLRAPARPARRRARRPAATGPPRWRPRGTGQPIATKSPARTIRRRARSAAAPAGRRPLGQLGGPLPGGAAAAQLGRVDVAARRRRARGGRPGRAAAAGPRPAAAARAGQPQPDDGAVERAQPRRRPSPSRRAPRARPGAGPPGRAVQRHVDERRWSGRPRASAARRPRDRSSTATPRRFSATRAVAGRAVDRRPERLHAADRHLPAARAAAGRRRRPCRPASVPVTTVPAPRIVNARSTHSRTGAVGSGGRQAGEQGLERARSARASRLAGARAHGHRRRHPGHRRRRQPLP